MGWGCYKHEVDAGSPNWDARMRELCDLQLGNRPLTWGRDGEVCPFCYEELVAASDKMIRALLEINGREHAETCALEVKAGPDCDCHVSVAKAALRSDTI